MQNREQNAHKHRQHEAQRNRVVHQFRHQQTAQQRAEKSEAHGDGQGKFFQREQDAASAIAGNAAGHDDAVGHQPHRNCRIDVRQRRRQGHRHSLRRHALNAQQFKERTNRDVHSRAEYVHAEEPVAVRAVRLRHIPEERNQCFQCALQLAGNELEVRNCENSQQRRHNQQQSRNHPVGNDRRVHPHPQKSHLVVFMQHGILHDRLNGLGFLSAWVSQKDGCKQGRQQYDHHKDEPYTAVFLLLLHIIPRFRELLLGKPCTL